MSLVLAIAALLVSVLAIRRADVVDKRVTKRVPDSGVSLEAEPGPQGVATASVSAPLLGEGVLESTSEAEILRRLDVLESLGSGGRSGGIRRLALVRYDAFEDTGGQLSYSLALVDDEGRGIVLTAIHGRSETRTYVKQVSGLSDSPQEGQLSPEEKQALRDALKSA